MFKAEPHEYLVAPDQDFILASAQTSAPDESDTDKKLKKQLTDTVKQFSKLQRKLYADNRYSLLLVFQAMDAAGKDSTIRNVLKGVNPAGCQVFSFKQPSKEELDHDFLWRSAKRLPERGRIGVFNRSYYEEVLVVKVHPEYLKYQNLPYSPKPDELWQQRYESINDNEKHLARNGTIILKFWLNVSREEQAQRFLSRLEDPEKNWKFSADDLEKRALWDEYMNAYETMLNQTSKPWAPWYAIPADNKRWMRLKVAEIITETLENLDIDFPQVDALGDDVIKQYRDELRKPVIPAPEP